MIASTIGLTLTTAAASMDINEDRTKKAALTGLGGILSGAGGGVRFYAACAKAQPAEVFGGLPACDRGQECRRTFRAGDRPVRAVCAPCGDGDDLLRRDAAHGGHHRETDGRFGEPDDGHDHYFAHHLCCVYLCSAAWV